MASSLMHSLLLRNIYCFVELFESAVPGFGGAGVRGEEQGWVLEKEWPYVKDSMLHSLESHRPWWLPFGG